MSDPLIPSSCTRPPLHVTLIGNPTSGRGRGALRMAEAAALLRARGCEVRISRTERPGHAAELARELFGTDLLLVSGGDGTFRDAVAGIVGADLPVALLPSGTGNDLARTLGIPRAVDAAIEIALGETERRLDVWSWNEVPFVNVAGLGLDAMVAQAVNTRFPFLHGTAAYVCAFASVFPGFRPFPLRLSWSEGAWEGKAWLAAFGNGVCYGGGMRIVPDAAPDDGWLDVVVVEDVSRLTLLQQFPRLFSGEHVKHPRVRRIRASEFQVETPAAPQTATIDGELIAQTPAAIRRLPHALRVRVPG